MNIIVAGCGNIGQTIIKSMVGEKHNVTAIDVDRELISSVTNIYDIMGICGNCVSYETLDDAGTKNADLFIAVTNLDEVNMLSCYLAKKMGAKHTVCRTRDYEYNNKSFDFVKDQLSLDVTINPELLTAQYIFNLLKLPSATKVETFSRNSFEVVELVLKENSPILNLPLLELRKKIPINFLIYSILREDNVIIPNGSFTLKAGDKIGLISPITESHKLLKLMGFSNIQIKDVLIVGASKTACYLAELLIKSKNDVKIIEKDRQKCADVSFLLNDEATVVCGDGMSHELLSENRIGDTDAFVTLTGQDEENILMSFYAINKGVKRVITKINKSELLTISNKLDVENPVSAKNVVANVLVSYARALSNCIGNKIETLYSLMDGKAEAVEFSVLNDFKCVDIPLKNLKFKNNVLIAGIIRDRNCIIPCGEDVIRAGDNVIIITAGNSLYDLSDVISIK